jgi:putative hydrolase of the HAD superfamily
MTPSPSDQKHNVTKAVVFDLGGVLIELYSAKARRELVDEYGILPERFDALTRSCFTSSRRSITERAMIGAVTTSEYLASFLRECTRKDIEGIRDNRLSVIGRERRAVFGVANRLRERGVTCCVLSNTIPLHWEKLKSRRDYPLLGEFEHVFASHLIARAKPLKNAFSFVANALRICMSQCLLVDDTLVNVDRAKAAGWRGLLFRDAASLERELPPLLRQG